MENWLSDHETPFSIFEDWYKKASELTSFEPSKMTLASVDPNGMPSARVVLLKQQDERGFCFFTNYTSPKSIQLLSNPKGTLVFHWEKPFHRQVRIQGLAEKMTYAESDAYFQTRSRGSQIGAWASPQSQSIASREELETRVKDLETQHPEGSSIPCPEFWGGIRIRPLTIEFWQSADFRLHDRLLFSRADLDSSWSRTRLAP